jgi:hypothetical protein
VLIVYKFFKNFNEIEKLNGKVTGSVALFTEKILLNNQNIFLKDISLISLVVFDFSHRREVYLISTPYPSLSNGFGNILTIKLINGEIIETNFEQKYQEEFLRKNKEMLIDYYKMGKISLLNLLDVFGIDDYDDIQDFKKSVLKI